MEFETSKNLSGIGAILMFISVLPYISGYTFGLLGLVGLMLLLIGMKGLAEYYQEASIFNNALYGSIAAIVGGVTSVAVIVYAAFGLLADLMPNWNGDWTNIPQLDFSDITSNINLSTIGSFVATVLLALVILFVFVVIVAVLYRKSLNSLKEKSGVGMFGTASTVLLIGSILTIILVGVFLVWISVLLTAIAFFQLRPAPTSASTM
ncbi:MAG: DUF996 domain-containing protein [Candidatus Bathyarchaeota archaeon]|nr:DUF996 domain-containing protein [Candidatus Bathyarchaeota archaeon]